VIVLWLPLAAFLSLIFHPTFNAGIGDVLAFFIAIWGAYVIRSLELWMLGLVTFWTTRVGPVFDVFFTAELLLSGRLVPLALMPDWAQQLANFFPFKWTFGFPIEALIGQLPASELLGGLAIQGLWIALLTGVVMVGWRFAVRRFSAVGG
jgi:ABC-2 type transport system permease protein